MPTLIENKTLEDNVNLCSSLGFKFIEKGTAAFS